MPKGNNGKEKKRPGRPTYRTFHDRIGFQVAAPLHQTMKTVAAERSVRLEEVYTEAIKLLLKQREREQVLFTAAPSYPLSSRVAVPMDPDLIATIRAVSKAERQRLIDIFQTAVRLYLDNLGRLP